GARPDQLVVTYPLRPGDASEPVLAAAAERVVGPAVTLIPAPVAAVAKLADDRDLGDEALVAVLDVGGSSVDATLVRRTPEALDLVGDPVSRTDLGGVDLDAVVLALVENAIGDITSVVTPGDYAAMVALRRVRASCRAAKERLSTEPAAVVEVALPHARGRVEITREAFEEAAAPALSDATDVLLSAISDAGLLPADLSLVLLTGGSSRIPLLRRMVAERTGLPVAGDEAPELTVALGAALFADAGAAGDDRDGPDAAAAGAAGALAALAEPSAAGADPDATVAAPPAVGWAGPPTGELPAAAGDGAGAPWDRPAASTGELLAPGDGWGPGGTAGDDATRADETWAAGGTWAAGDRGEPGGGPASGTGDDGWSDGSAEEGDETWGGGRPGRRRLVGRLGRRRARALGGQPDVGVRPARPPARRRRGRGRGHGPAAGAGRRRAVPAAPHQRHRPLRRACRPAEPAPGPRAGRRGRRRRGDRRAPGVRGRRGGPRRRGHRRDRAAVGVGWRQRAGHRRRRDAAGRQHDDDHGPLHHDDERDDDHHRGDDHDDRGRDHDDDPPGRPHHDDGDHHAPAAADDPAGPADDPAAAADDDHHDVAADLVDHLLVVDHDDRAGDDHD